MTQHKIPLVWKILIGFALGIVGGLCMAEWASPTILKRVNEFVSPFGTVLVSMLKMVVYPIIAFSLIVGAASLPLRKAGKLGGMVLVWYFLTSIFATVFGVFLAYLLNPEMAQAADAAGAHMAQVHEMATASSGGGFGEFIAGLFKNPFEALASGSFLPIIVFAISFGLAARYLIDGAEENSLMTKSVRAVVEMCDGAQKISFKLIDWVMLYFPIGVFALTFTNFSTNGALLFGPYVRIVLCVMAGVCGMIFVVYPLALFCFTGQNPYVTIAKFREPILTAFITRSSAATLPVSFGAMDRAGVQRTLSSFSLPMGATVNMDGVCVHLPVFVILAANLFGMDLSLSQLFTLVVSVVFASVGAGGIPGGSVFLLFMVLENLGLNDSQVAMIVSLALGINPILDMFETCCNVAGDNVCTYIVAKRNGLIKEA